MKTKKSAGFCIVAAAAVLTIVSLFLYPGVFAQNSQATLFLWLSLAAGAAALGISFVLKKELTNLVAGAFSVLLMLAFCFSVVPMVEPIAYWYSGLYDYGTVSGYFTFGIVWAIAWLLSVVGSFAGVTDKD